LVGAEQIVCNDCPDLEVAIRHLRDPDDHHLDAAWGLRADYRADVVALFIEPGPNCG
jgi:hypothetical protein